MELNEIGRIVAEEWKRTARIRNFIELDKWVVMPDHFHGILIIFNCSTACRTHTDEQFGKPVTGSLPTIIRSFKSAVTNRVNKFNLTPSTKIKIKKRH